MNNRKKRIVSFILSICMIAGCFSAFPQLKADAAVANWNGIDSSGVATTNTLLSYKSYPADTTQYLSKATIQLAQADLCGAANKNMRLIYDYTDENNYHYFMYRFAGSGVLYGSLGKIEAGRDMEESTAFCTSQTSTGKALPLNKATTGGTAITTEAVVTPETVLGTKVAQNYTIEVVYSEDCVEITFYGGFDETASTKYIFTIKSSNKSYETADNRLHLYTTDNVTFQDINMVTASTQKPVSKFSNWDNIGDNGKVRAGKEVQYNNYPTDERYLAKVIYRINGRPISGAANKAVRLIYYINASSQTYYYFEYRLNGSDDTIYGGFGKNVSGTDVAQTSDDMTFTEGANCKSGVAVFSATSNRQISMAALEEASTGHTVEIEYVAQKDVQFTFYGADAKKVSFVVTVKDSNAEFLGKTNRFLLSPTVDITIESIEASFAEILSNLTAEQYKELYTDILNITVDEVLITDEKIVQEALEAADKRCSAQDREELTEEITLLKNMVKRIADLKVQNSLGYTRPAVAEGFSEDFENGLSLWEKGQVEKHSSVTTQTGLLPNGGVNFNMDIVQDPTNAANNVLKVSGTQGAAMPYFFAVPADASLKTVSYDVVKFEDGYATYRLRLVPAYLDDQNFTKVEFNIKSNVAWTVRSTTYTNGNYTNNPGIVFKESVDLYEGFRVEMRYDVNALKVEVTIIPNSDPDAQETMTLPYPSPKSKMVLPVPFYAYSAIENDYATIYYDNIKATYTPKDWDDDIKIVDPVVYYTGNTLVSPGDPAMITGEELGKTVAKLEIVQLDNTTNSMGYILQNKYDYKATEALYTNASDAKTAFETHAADSKELAIIQRSDDAVKFIIPSEFEKGIYAVKITPKSSRAHSSYVYINMPETDYTVGDEGDVATSGGMVRIIGKNLALDGGEKALTDEVSVAACKLRAQIKKSKTDTPKDCKVIAVQSKYSVTVKLPENLTRGVYELSIYNGYGDNTCWSAPISITVGPSPRDKRSDAVFDVTHYGANPSPNNANDMPAIIKAIEAAALYKDESTGTVGGTVYLPAGHYVIPYALAIPENVYLKGAGIGITYIVFSSVRYDFGELPDTVIAVTDNVELSDFTLSIRRGENSIKAAVACDNIYIHDVKIQNDPEAGSITNGAGGEPLVSNAESKLLLTEEQTGNFYGFSFRGTGDNSVYMGNTYNNIQIYNCEYRGPSWGFCAVTNSVIQDNLLQGSHQTVGGGGFPKIIGSSNIFENNSHGKEATAKLYGALEGNGIYIGGNTMGNVRTNNGEIITNDGQMNYGNGRTGIIMKDTSYNDNLHYRIMTGQSYAENRWFGSQVYVKAGQGKLQYRTITYSKGDMIVIDTPFVIEPNRNSRVAFEDGRANLFNVNNQFSNGAYVGSYGTQVGAIFDGNSFKNCHGIKQQTHDEGPNWYSCMVNNHFTNMMHLHVDGEGSDTPVIGGVHFQGNGKENDFYGITVRACDFSHGGNISLIGDGKGHATDFILDNCQFNDAEHAIKYTITQADSMKGILVTRMSYNNIEKPITGRNRNEDRDAYRVDYTLAQDTIGTYNTPHLYIYDMSLSNSGLFLIGDVNMDGVVNEQDVLLIRYFLTGKVEFTDEMKKRGDINADQEVTFEDALRLYKSKFLENWIDAEY